MKASPRSAPCSAPRRCRCSTRPPAWCGRCCAGPSSTPTSPVASARRAARAPVSYTHLRAHETRHDLVCRLLLEKKKKNTVTKKKKQKKKKKRKYKQIRKKTK